MKRVMRIGQGPSRALVLVLALGAAGTGAYAQEKGDPARGEKLFRACRACHTTTSDGGNIVGPRLFGLFDRRAGAVSDYNYSDALKGANFSWNDETLDKLFALGPDEFTPGSKMPLQEMANSRDRADLIAYLRKVTAAEHGAQ